LSLNDGIAPNIETCHVVQLLLQRIQLIFICLGIQVARSDRLLEEILSILFLIAVKQNTVEILVELGGLVLHQELHPVNKLSLFA